MSHTQKAISIYQQLVKIKHDGHPNQLQECIKLLDQVKLILTHMSFLPTSNQVNKQDLIIARDCLEIGAQVSVAAKDIPSFERYLSQLKCYYFDFSDELPESAYKYQLLGLNLLCLLSQNRVAEFHTELELLPPEEIQKNIYIRHPVSLEQWLMEGCYNKVFLSKDNIPAESYAYFVDILLDTVRIEIGDCLEKGYDTISQSEATRMMFFTDVKQLIAFVNQGKRKWSFTSDGNITWVKSTPHSDSIPCLQLACKALEYATQLEMIV